MPRREHPCITLLTRHRRRDTRPGLVIFDVSHRCRHCGPRSPPSSSAPKRPRPVTNPSTGAPCHRRSDAVRGKRPWPAFDRGWRRAAARTVDSHVRSILNKLGFNSRAQIAAWMAAQEAASLKEVVEVHLAVGPVGGKCLACHLRGGRGGCGRPLPGVDLGLADPFVQRAADYGEITTPDDQASCLPCGGGSAGRPAHYETPSRSCGVRQLARQSGRFRRISP